MSYTIRNTIILAAFWTIILAVGFYNLYGRQGKIKKQLIAEKTQKFKKVTRLEELARDRTELYEFYQKIKDMHKDQNCVITAGETPGETYDYILREVKRDNAKLDLDLVFMQEDSVQGVSHKVYAFSGEGNFVDLYKIIWFIENGPIYYDLRSISIDRIDRDEIGPVANQAEISFSSTLHSYSGKEGPSITLLNESVGEPVQLANMVKPMFKSYMPEPVRAPKTNYAAVSKPAPVVQRNTEGLPEISASSELLAITPFSVMVKGNKGRTYKLRKGDRIFGGYLQNINPVQHNAVFQISKGGGSSPLVLTLVSK